MRTVRSSKYFTISNQTAQDVKLSFEALGLLTYCLSMPQDWEFHPKVIWKERKTGRDAVYNAFNELILSNHCIRVRKPNPKANHLPGEIEYEIFDEPEDCLERVAELLKTEKFVEHSGNLKKCFRHPAFPDPTAWDPENPDLLKETQEKINKEKKETPPPPEPPPSAPPSSAGGGGGLSSSLIVGDWTYRNVRGEAISLTQSQIFRHFVRLSFTTEILQEAIKQAMGSNELIGDPWKYLEAICFRLTQEEKVEKIPATAKKLVAPILPCKNTEPKVGFLDLNKKAQGKSS